jgi:hypothetical protein
MNKKFLSLALLLLLITSCQPRELSPVQVVSKMFQQMSQLRTASFTTTAQIKSSAQTRKLTQILLTRGYFDLSDFNQPKIMLRGSIKKQFKNSFQAKGKLRVTENTIYLKVLELWLDTNKLPLPHTVNQWLDLGKLYQKQIKITQTEQRKLRTLLTTFNILKNITEHQKEEVEGKPLRHLSARLNHRAFKKLLIEAAAIVGNKIDDRYFDLLEKKIKQAVLDLWIEERDFYLYRLETTFVIAFNKEETISVKFAVKFWDFNQVKTVPQPNKAKKINWKEILTFYH